MQHKTQQILLEASSLEVGESSTVTRCPSCGGGRTREASFSVSRIDEGVLYNCYRASCQYAGFIPTKAALVTPKKVRESKQKPYIKSTSALSEEVLEFLTNKFELTPEDMEYAGWRYGDEDGRIIMPVRNALGYDIGCVARDYDPHTTCKALAYPDGTGSPWLAYFERSSSSWIVLVEDIVSALKISKLCPAVALMGTSLNDTEAIDIASRFPNVLVWLDKDAIKQAYKLLEKYKLMFGNFIVHHGSNLDPKDTKLVDIESILKQYKVV